MIFMIRIVIQKTTMTFIVKHIYIEIYKVFHLICFVISPDRNNFKIYQVYTWVLILLTDKASPCIYHILSFSVMIHSMYHVIKLHVVNS